MEFEDVVGEGKEHIESKFLPSWKESKLHSLYRFIANPLRCVSTYNYNICQCDILSLELKRNSPSSNDPKLTFL